MARRRMMLISTMNSPFFIDLSQSARLLYFILSGNADDDGVVLPAAWMRMHRIRKPALSELQDAGFIHSLDADKGIYYIDNWTGTNTIDARIYVASDYQPLLLEQFPDTKIPSNKGKDEGKNVSETCAEEGSVEESNKGEGILCVSSKVAPSSPDVLLYSKPSFDQVYQVLTNNFNLDENSAYEEANRFIEYNERTNWLPLFKRYKTWTKGLYQWIYRKDEFEQEDN